MDEIYTQIEKYLAGQLNPAEKEVFEKRLNTDKEFAMEVEQFKDLMGGLRLHNNKVLKKRLNEIHEQVNTPASQAVVRPLNRKKWYAIIAAACLLLLLSVFLFNNRTTSPAELYASHYEPYEPDWTTRGTEDASTLAEIKNLYETKKYKALATILETDEIQAKLGVAKFNMIKGITHLEANEYAEARKSFSIASENPVIKPEAQWYTALSYLKENDIKNCKAILTPFAADKASDYYWEATRILERL